MSVRADTDMVLRKCKLFRDINPSDFEELKGKLSLLHRVIPADSRVCSTGDVGNELWIIVSGMVEIFRKDLNADYFISYRSEGEVVGEQSFFGEARTACIRAKNRTEVYSLKRDRLDSLDNQELKAIVWRNIASILSEKLAQSSDQREILTRDGAEADNLLNRFVNSHGLDRVRGGLRSDYAQESVVVWFSDLVGFGDVTANVQPDDVANLIRQSMQIQSKIVEESGGYVDKFMGDGLMAFWTFPPDNDTLRQSECVKAFEAAQEAIRAIEALKSPLSGHALGLRVGLHVGRAISGNFGSDDRWAYTLIGQDVNIAARLEQVKGNDDQGMPFGSLRVSEEFRDLLPTEKQGQVRCAGRVRVKELDRLLFCSYMAPKEGQHDQSVDSHGC